jgi:hypothetical protein
LIDEYLTQGGNAHGIDADTLDREARLVAAAPDLLAALESVLRFCVTPSGFPDKGKGRTECQQIAFDLARTAIAKATGA